MEEKLVIILNEMAEYLSIAQMKKLQEVLLKNLAENEPQKAHFTAFLCHSLPLPGLLYLFLLVNVAQSLPLLVVLPPVCLRLNLSFALPGCSRGYCSYL